MSRWRRRALWAAAAMAPLLLAALFAPGPIARRLLPRLRPGGGTLSGGLIRGVVLEDVRYQRPGLAFSARRLTIRPAWHGLLRRHLTIEKLSVVSPRLRVEAGRAPREAPGNSRWTVSVRRFAVTGGALEVVSSSGTRRVDAVDARGSVRRGTLALQRASARALGLTWIARGRVSRKTSALDVSLSGATTGELRLSEERSQWRVEGRGRWRGAAWALDGHGAGASLDDLRAAFDVQAWERDGPSARGRVAVSSGAASFEVAFSSGLSGTLAGTARLRERDFDARWRLSGGRALARLGLSARALAVQGQASGRWPDARWRAQLRASGVSAGQASARSLAVSASGRGRALSMRVTALGARAGKTALSRLVVQAAGTAESHVVSFAVDAGSVAAAGSGRGRWRGGIWSARWTQLALSKPRTMRADAPFTTAFSRGRFEVSGLSLSGERESRLTWTARKEGAVWPRFSLKALFDLQMLYELGLLRAPTSGRVDLTADLRGDLHAPSGTAAFDITHARLADIDAGSATVRVAFDGRVARLQRFDWELGSGRAVLSGTVPLKMHDKRDFQLRVQAMHLGLSPFARHLTAVLPTKPLLDADVTLTRETGRWSLRGGGTADAETLTIPSAGLALGPSSVVFEARGDRLAITHSALTPPGKGAKAFLTGSISPDGPALRVSAQKLHVDTGQGASGDADAVVSIEGSWDAPAVTGTVHVRRGELVPLTARQKRSIDAEEGQLAAARHRSSPSTLDLRLLFDGNVWYRERATAIELKGDVRLRKKPNEPIQMLGTVDTVRGDYVYFSRVFKVESGSLKLAGETPMDAAVSARALYVDDATRTKVHLALTGTLAQPQLDLTSEPPMDERDIVSFLATGRPLYEVGGVEGKQVGGTAEAASVIADYMSQGLRRYLPPRLALDVFRLEAQRGQPGVTVGRYITRRLFVTYGQTTGAEGGHKVDATYTLSPHWSIETQSTNQRTDSVGTGATSATDNIVDLLFSFGFR